MAFTAGFSVNVGDPTKASDVDVLAANDDYLKNAIDTFIANDANNRVLTATGSGTANAESNLTFDGSTLTVTGTVSATTLSGNVTGGTISGTTGSFSSTLGVTGATTLSSDVGIGTSATATNRLTLSGNQVILASGELKLADATNAQVGTIKNSNSSGAQLDFITGSTAMVIDSSQRVGIGTSSAGSYSFNNDARLVVANTSANSTISIVSGTSSSGYLSFADGTTGTDRYSGQIQYNHGTNTMSFKTGGGVEAMTINSAQDLAVDTDTLFVDASADRVGINTASPQGTVHAHLATDKNIRLQVIGAYAGIGALNDASSSYIQMNLEASDLVVGQYSGGNLSLPNSYLKVSGNPSAGTISSNGNGQIGGLTGNGLYMYGKGSTYDLALANANTTVALAIPTGGSATPNVYIPNSLGIGTSSPARGLHLEGDSGTSAIRLETTGGEWEVAPFYSTFTDGNFAISRIAGSGNVLIPSGNVGIGTVSPSGRLHVEGGGIYHIGSSLKYIASSSVQSISSTNNAGAELTTDAYLWINRSSAPCVFLNRTTTTGSIAVFYSDLTAVGSISVTASATAYNTSSDYRLKENLAPITGAVDRVNALQPRRFNFISDPDTTVDGFLAHEVSDIVPEAITGEKDAVDADGNPEYQGIDQSKLVPLLTAAIQELTARIEALEAA